ncbi:MAG TPA: MarR family transcriptional regulator [Candidatus Deferrimicrobium sp.]|nr:MarR family transcriptional regulator [Candidatus Deferrimicrobium sp.]
MFEKWEIPEDICNVFPIGYNNLELFVGHSGQTKFLSDLLSNQSVIVLEGEIGVGKTSMGNYVRHSKKGYFSPSQEIPCKPKWDNDTFMAIVLAAIVNEVMRKGSPHSALRKQKLIQKLNETFSDVKLANFGLNGAGFGFQKGETMARSLFLNQTILIDYLVQIGQLFQENYHKTAPIIIQINNLDSEYGFEQEDLVRFLNEIRDTLQIPHISWLICGAEGLENFIRKNVPRVRQITGSFMTVNPLSFKEVMDAFNLRIKKGQLKGRLPIDTNLMEYIYDIANGSFREILNIVYQLLVKYSNEPLVKIINMEHARYFFYQLAKPRVERLKRSPIQYPVFEAILNNPGINQTELAKLVKKQQANVSRVTKELEADGYISVKRVSRTSYYYADTKYQIGFSDNFL